MTAPGNGVVRWEPKSLREIDAQRARVEPAERKAVTLPQDHFWLDANPLAAPFAFSTTGWEDVTGRTMGGLTLASAYRVATLAFTCMQYRAQKLAEAPLWIADELRGQDVTWLEGAHPLEALLEQANPDQTMADLLEQVSLYLDAGRVLLRKVRARNGRVAELYAFSRDEFTAEPANGRRNGRVRVYTTNGEEAVDPDDVIVIREPQDVGPLQVVLSELQISGALRTAIIHALGRAAMPGATVETAEELTPHEIAELRSSVSTMYGGVQNAGKVMLLMRAKLNQLKTPVAELDVGPVQSHVEATVCAAFGVHPILLGLKTGLDATRGFADSLEPAQTLFYDRVGRPRWTRVSNALTLGLLREVEPDRMRRFIRFDTSAVAALQDDRAQLVETASKAMDFLTLDEVRALAGYEPLADGETPARGARAAAPVGEGEAGDETPADDAADGQDDAPPMTQRSARPVIAHKARVDFGSADAVKAAWAAFDTKAARDENAYERAAAALFAVERADVARRLLDALPDGLKAAPGDVETKDADDVADRARWALADPYIEAALLRIEGDYAPGGAYHRAWLDRYLVLIGKTVQTAGDDLAAQWGFDFTLANPRVQAVIRERAAELVENVSDTTKRRIRALVAEARDEGIGMRQLAKRIRDDAFGGDTTALRARTIARTETVGALNAGEHAAALESGVLQAKRWLHQRVGASRENHVREEGSGWVGIAEPFPVTGKQRPHDGIGGADEDVNCRCGVAYDDRTPQELAG